MVEASTTALYPLRLPIKDKASNTWALEILGTQSIPNAVSFFSARVLARVEEKIKYSLIPIKLYFLERRLPQF